MKGQQGEGFFKAYEEYSRVLRTWLVAYGIGAPAVFLTNETLSKLLLKSVNSKSIGALFLLGVAIQVVMPTLNKHCMWLIYYGETTTSFKHHWAFKAANWMSERIWIDFVFDALAIALFSLGTWWSYEVVFTPR
jgi:hypothetical protein